MKIKYTLALAATCLLIPSLGLAQVGDGANFEPVSDYVVEVAGQPMDSAEVFYSQLKGAYLVLDDGLSAPLLISPRERRVSTLQFLKVNRLEDGAVKLLPQAEMEDQGDFSVVGNEAQFSVDGQPAALKPKPDVLGDHSLDQMRTSSAAYVYRSNKYQASDAVVGELRNNDDPVSITVYFGSWCPACGQGVPRLMSVAGKLTDAPYDFNFHGLPRQIKTDPLAAQNGITSVPTAIVYQGGREIGRLSGQDWKVPELALSKLIGSS